MEASDDTVGNRPVIQSKYFLAFTNDGRRFRIAPNRILVTTEGGHQQLALGFYVADPNGESVTGAWLMNPGTARQFAEEILRVAAELEEKKG